MRMARNKVGAYAPCPCGSGRKFKFCCRGKSSMPPLTGDLREVGDPLAADIARAIDSAGTPQGTIVRSVEWEKQSKRVRAVGNTVYLRPPKETFHAFLIHFVIWTL